MRAGLRLVFSVVLLSAVISALHSSPLPAQSNRVYESPQFGYFVEWLDPWVQVDSENHPGEYDYVRLETGDLYHEFYGISTNLADPAVILDQFVQQFRSATTNLTVTQRWDPGGGSHGPWPMIIEFEGTNGVPMTEFLYAWMVKGRSFAMVSLDGRPKDRQTDDLEHLLGLINWNPPSLPSEQGSENASQVSCEVVELYPGYPGYRGNVPGVNGAGDTVCLEDLAARDPDFSRASEDMANRAAATRLGVSGDFEDWTWETWMAIDVERGLTAVCYSCIWYAPTQFPPPVQAQPADFNDPRMLLGRYGERSLAFGFADERQLNRSTFYDAPTDDQLRAMAGMMSPGHYLTASEMADLIDQILTIHYCVDGPPCQWWDNHTLYQNLLAQGGYAPTPGNASETDQFYMILEGVTTIAQLNIPLMMQEGFVNRFIDAFQDWQFAGLQRPSFAQYLIDQGAESWL